MKNFTELPAWQALAQHQAKLAHQQMRDWFAIDPKRFTRFSLKTGGLLLDYSRNRITQETIPLLVKLADAIDLSGKIKEFFNGAPINHTEGRAVLHTALRAPTQSTISIKGTAIGPAIGAMREKMRAFVTAIHDQTYRGMTNQPIRHIVNIGIGGSHVGPLMTTQALKNFANPNLSFHFISTVDKANLEEVLKKIDPAATLFIISSKSFTTIETLTNAATLLAWMKKQFGEKVIEHHFIAITAATDKAIAWGIPADHIFPLWDWVGGRYSIWSAIGLPLMLMIGYQSFTDFLHGAYEMDQHFQSAPLEKNMPALLALLGIWYLNFFGASAQAIVPYAYSLRSLVSYLQQADMESNGKSIDSLGNDISYTTSPVIFGEEGCNGQHTYHQLLHQGRHLIPVDFILIGQDESDRHHDLVIASALSQAQALMQGKTQAEAYAELIANHYPIDDAKTLSAHRSIPGNRPSNIICLDTLSPYHLGALLALYEHKIFVQGIIWNINSFDQWGVELGKQLLPTILAQIQQPSDETTNDLIQHLYKRKAP